MTDSPLPTYDQWQAISDALDRAVSLRESGEGGGHAYLIQLLNKLGHYPMSSYEAEQVAQGILDEGYSVSSEGRPADL